MPSAAHLVLTPCLFGIGVLAWSFGGKNLISNPAEWPSPNPMGINGSPYGEVVAMAMQGPIGTYFDGAMSLHATKVKVGPLTEFKASSRSLDKRFERLLISLEKAGEIRTNPKGASDAHKLYLRRKTEDKLRFAYQLDPSHYANYNSLHFFLSEPALGTRPQLSAATTKLAEDTLRYCLAQEHDPRPYLTAAAAASNVLELMITDYRGPNRKVDLPQMKQCLGMLEHCLARYQKKALEWDQTRQWELLSPQRITECDDRFKFILKIHEVSGEAIERFERELSQPQASI